MLDDFLRLVPSIPLPVVIALLAAFPLAYIVQLFSLKLARKKGGFYHALISLFIVFGVSIVHIIACSFMIIDALSGGERLETGQAGATGIMIFFIFILPYLIISLLFWIYLILKAYTIRKNVTLALLFEQSMLNGKSETFIVKVMILLPCFVFSIIVIRYFENWFAIVLGILSIALYVFVWQHQLKKTTSESPKLYPKMIFLTTLPPTILILICLVLSYYFGWSI